MFRKARIEAARKELEERLERAIDSEEYEEAARIQEELNKRNNNL